MAERLARTAGFEVVVGGRNEAQARAAAGELARAASAVVSHLSIDATRPDIEALRRLAPAVIVNASGPFQTQDYALARAAIAVGAHYIDLADAREFVTGITALDSAARAAGVLVTSGASSVPALAAAIVDHHAPKFSRLDAIEHGIVPANGYDPGRATTASILGGVGRPFLVLVDGQWQTVHGWSGLSRIRFPGLGVRYVSPVDVPDLALFPERYPGVRTVRFSAGLEVALFQWSLAALAWAVRHRLMTKPERFAAPLMWLKRRLSALGSQDGGMYVRLFGLDATSKPMGITVYLIARRNQGPYMPAIAAVVLARKLVQGRRPARGALPCLGLVSLEDFMAEVADLDITITSTSDEL